MVALGVVDRSKAKELLGDAFERVGLPREWGIALGLTESNLDPDALNNLGPDAARGGAWGLTQITEKTARAYGYTGSMADLLKRPDVAADLSAKIAAAGNVKTIEDLGAWWNAGRRTASLLPAGHVTLTTYIPRLKAKLAEV